MAPLSASLTSVITTVVLPSSCSSLPSKKVSTALPPSEVLTVVPASSVMPLMPGEAAVASGVRMLTAPLRTVRVHWLARLSVSAGACVWNAPTPSVTATTAAITAKVARLFITVGPTMERCENARESVSKMAKPSCRGAGSGCVCWRRAMSRPRADRRNSSEGSARSACVRYSAV